MSDKKYFSVEEANSVLEELSSIVKELVELKNSIEVNVPKLKPVMKKLGSNGGGHKDLNLHLVSIKKMEELINTLNAAGCILKDVNQGLIDFPHLKDGREVYLCWKLGEKRVSYWHEVDAGYAGRKPIDSDNNLID